MIIKATINDISLIKKYIKNDPISNIYIEADIDKYGLHTDFLDVWIQTINGDITAIIMRYYNGMQFYSKTAQFDVDEIGKLLKKISPQIISGQYRSLSKLITEMNAIYKIEIGSLATYKGKKLCGGKIYDNYIVEKAILRDVDEISELIRSDSQLGQIYTQSEIAHQLRERIKDKFGRSYVIRVGGKIVSHAATYCETNSSAVIGGVITAPTFRRKGYSATVVRKLCEDLINEGKTPCLFYYSHNAGEMYHKLGFFDYTRWAKLTKVNK